MYHNLFNLSFIDRAQIFGCHFTISAIPGPFEEVMMQWTGYGVQHWPQHLLAKWSWILNYFEPISPSLTLNNVYFTVVMRTMIRCICKYLIKYTVVNPTALFFVIIIIKISINKALKYYWEAYVNYSLHSKAMQ